MAISQVKWTSLRSELCSCSGKGCAATWKNCTLWWPQHWNPWEARKKHLASLFSRNEEWFALLDSDTMLVQRTSTPINAINILSTCTGAIRVYLCFYLWIHKTAVTGCWNWSFLAYLKFFNRTSLPKDKCSDFWRHLLLGKTLCFQSSSQSSLLNYRPILAFLLLESKISSVQTNRPNSILWRVLWK